MDTLKHPIEIKTDRLSGERIDRQRKKIREVARGVDSKCCNIFHNVNIIRQRKKADFFDL